MPKRPHRGKRLLGDGEILTIMRCRTARELHQQAERLGVTPKYVYALRQQLDPRSLRLAAKHDIPKPPALPRVTYRDPVRGLSPIEGERELIRRIMAGDE